MNIRRGIPFLLVGLALGVAVGAFASWHYMRSACDRELRSIWLTSESDRAFIAVKILKLNEQQRTDKLVRLAEMQLESSLYQIGRLSKEGAELGIPAANLIAGVTEARDYAVEHSLGGVREANWFLERVNQGL